MELEASSRIRRGQGEAVELFADGARRLGCRPRSGWDKLQQKKEQADKLGVEPASLLPSEGHFPSPIYISTEPYFISREIDEYLCYWAVVGKGRIRKTPKERQVA